MAFSGNAFQDYRDAGSLAGQLSGALTELMSKRRATVIAAMERVSGQTVEDGPHWDARRRRFREERDALVAAGLSDDGLIDIETVGLRDWDVDVEPYALSRLTASGFTGSFASAMTDLWQNHTVVLTELKIAHDGQW
ncbi:hypothetical protein [Stackebrandtia soli]|uniref:hypothetical protein n=1 Tax=Stackebrandtia soli TaxID=1892856 RepID=UPI0039E9136A